MIRFQDVSEYLGTDLWVKLTGGNAFSKTNRLAHTALAQEWGAVLAYLLSDISTPIRHRVLTTRRIVDEQLTAAQKEEHFDNNI